MKLKAKYAKREDIPEGYEDLFEERGGEWLLVHIEGFDSGASVARLERALERERDAHRKTKERYDGLDLGELSVEDAQARLDGWDELEAKAAAGGGSVDEEAIQKRIDAAVQRQLTPVQRRLDRATTRLDETLAENKTLQGTLSKRDIHDVIRRECANQKVRSEAVDDILMYDRAFEVLDGEVVAKEGVGLPPGLSIASWLEDQKEKKPHWWPEASGGNSKGGDGGSGANPWADKDDIDGQTAYVKKHGIDRARKRAAEAGVTL